MIEVSEIRLANLPDCTRLCVGGSLPPALDAFAAVDMQRAKMAFLRDRMEAGAAALGAYRDGRQVGILEWYPVEHSPTPVAGEDLFVVHCARTAPGEPWREVAGALVKAAEAPWSKRSGVAALGRRKPWQELGFEVLDRRRTPERDGEMQTLFLRKYRPEAKARFLDPAKLPRPEPGRLRVDLFLSDRCPWNRYVYDVVRRACEAHPVPVLVVEHDCGTRTGVERFGTGSGVAVNGEFQPLLRPHLLPDQRTVRRILEGG